MSIPPAQTKSPPIENFLATVLLPLPLFKVYMNWIDSYTAEWTRVSLLETAESSACFL